MPRYWSVMGVASVPAVPWPGAIRLVPGLVPAIDPDAMLYAVVLPAMRQLAKTNVPPPDTFSPVPLNAARSLTSVNVAPVDTNPDPLLVANESAIANWPLPTPAPTELLPKELFST